MKTEVAEEVGRHAGWKAGARKENEEEKTRVRVGKTWQTQHSRRNRHSSVSRHSQKSGRWGWKLWLCSSDLRWKQSEGRREREDKTRETKTDWGEMEGNEQSLTETALMIPHSVSQLQMKKKKNNKHTKTKQKPWTSKQFNWKCWVLQVCGWLGLLAMIYPRPNSSCILHSLLCVVKSSLILWI